MEVYDVLIVLIVFAFVFGIVKMGLRYSENKQRIQHGYPLRDGSRPENAPPERESDNTRREQ